jgi:hypothetical protein
MVERRLQQHDAVPASGTSPVQREVCGLIVIGAKRTCRQRRPCMVSTRHVKRCCPDLPKRNLAFTTLPLEVSFLMTKIFWYEGRRDDSRSNLRELFRYWELFGGLLIGHSAKSARTHLVFDNSMGARTQRAAFTRSAGAGGPRVTVTR